MLWISKSNNSAMIKIYTDWANHHLEKTGVKSVIQDLPKDISDGVLLADIVHFVCGEHVERIHSKPTTAKEKLHNIDRCLKVLESHRVVLNDVTAQGLYRRELKCVLALFFHLSRFKQKGEQFKMADCKSTPRRTLRPPTAVSVNRKSKSFNANDRTRINPVSEPTNPQNDEPPANNTDAGWRSKSMSTKHSATTRLVAPKTHTNSLQKSKLGSPASNVQRRPPSSGSGTLEKKSKLATNSRSAKLNGHAKPVPPTRVSSHDPERTLTSTNAAPKHVTSSNPPSRHVTSSVAGSNRRPEARSNAASSRSNVEPKSVTSSTRNHADVTPSTTSRTKLQAPSTQTRSTQLKRPEGKSVFSRIKKLGSATPSENTSSKSVTSSGKSRSTSPAEKSAANKKRAESCPPTSRTLSAAKPRPQNLGTTLERPGDMKKSKLSTVNKNGLKSPSGLKSVKSSFGKAFGKSPEKRKSPMTEKPAPKTPETPSPMETLPPPVPPRTPLDVIDISPKVTGSKTLPREKQPQVHHEPVSISLASPRPTSKPQKTATVAPFIRHPSVSDRDRPQDLKEEIPPPKPELPQTPTSSASTPKCDVMATSPAEAREQAVKGIADLRHNLEETMSSLRNTQLRHKKGDAFERRLSAHLDGEYDEIVAKLPDIPPALMSSNALCRSQNNLLTFRQSVHANSPKLHAGETLGHDSRYKFAPGRFSSLQRTRSARYTTRRAWHDVTAGYVSEGDAIASPEDGNNETFDDASSLSSCDISECIADVSTDEFSSAQNSPFHKALNGIKSVSESSSRLNDDLTNMAVEGSGKAPKFGKKKGIGKPPSGKAGLKAPGSSVVGSRLACNTISQSPTNNYGSPLQSIAGQRGALAYRSLPRPSKARFHDDKVPSQAKSKLDLSAEKSATSTFKRSPSLQKLLSLQSKPKQQQQQQPLAPEQEPMTSSEPPAFVYTNPNVTSPTSTTLSLSTFSSKSSPLKYDRSQYNSLGRRKGSSPRADHSSSSSPLSYMSLPRKPRATSSQSESPKPPLSSLNSSYMSMNLLTTPSLYLDETSSIHETDELFKEGNRLSYRGDVSDWPLPTLHSSDVAASSPNVARSTKSVSQSTHSLQQQRKSGRSQSLMASTPSLLSSQPTKNGDPVDIHSQLNTSAKVVSAFEESLSTMNCRLRELSVSAEQKDSELQELRATIESLKHSQSPDEWSSTTTSSASKLKKKASCGSLSSISSKASVSSMGSGEDARGRKKKHWLKESLKTAFGKRKSRPNLSVDLEEAEFNLAEAAGAGSGGSGAVESDVVAKLKEELLQKERKLTDIRLEALTSQHQLHQMQDAMQKMRTEMDNLRSENERLSRLGLSTMSLRSVSSVSRSMASLAGSQFSLNRDMTSIRLLVTLNFPQQMVHDDFDGTFPSSVTIGACYVTRSVTWKELDGKVRQAFSEYCEKIDPVDCLGLDSGIVTSYTVGEVTRDVGVGGSPELLPCGYIVGNVDSVSLEISDTFSVEMMALEMLTSRETIQRYCRLLLDHGRVMLSGPAGTGKTTLAKRLAEHIVRKVAKRGKDSIVYLDLKHRNENEIREYLLRLTEDCSKPESCAREIPVVLVLDDLQRSSSLGDAFHTLLTAAAHSQLPYLIGVVQQNQGPNLELHQEFRWILCSNHVPPVSEYLQRHLRKSLHVWETKSKCEAEDTMLRLVSWLPTCWKQINGCIESQNSADVTIGPRMFTPCPMEPHSSLIWFRDLWNFSIVPYVISAVKQSRKSTAGEWVDPLNWIKESWPWVAPCDLTPIRAEDVAHDPEGTSTPHGAPNQPQSRGDPLLNMLMKLQEAAATNYESDTSHDDAFERSLDRALGDLS